MPKIDLSIITISYNTKQITLDCLDSILKYTKGISYEVIVVDNGSKDGSVEAVRHYSKKFPQIILIDAQENLGFGRGNNLGVKKARGNYLLFLNSDTLLFDNALKEAYETVIKHPKVGAYSCRLLNADRSFQASGGHFPSFWSLMAWQFFIDDLPIIGDFIPSFHPKQSQYEKNKQMDWVTGAFMIVRKDIFDKAGGFDKNIFMYTEEMELCYRLSKLGYPTYYTNTPAIVHLGGASGGSYLALTLEIKNMIYFWRKHMPHWQIVFVKISFWIGSLLRLLIFGIIKGDAKARKAYFHALGFIF
ncbi:MAG: Glycosyltransferase-like protein, family 2 [Candidatus Collierbacteria bacterium GW2011_GWB1_44_6]|uniref:Glycosyltransferase-like protein, family 2 n=1 Tax=Candidatus Collierbacteria bacterium GW2011_GWB1_44_6 TaxID=1618384 RepID=A0A0G1JQP2_9BACT|nr:MAG: Glycosyltransferase-like protein, family 2 [Candidatus Collierbacteria bacterium GW2011_GWB1_44_6]KKT83390.1 MAG: Glycosyltransferase-like protein, family 2 [Microgenomates group bacterium GW2011_GWC1_44_9]